MQRVNVIYNSLWGHIRMVRERQSVYTVQPWTWSIRTPHYLNMYVSLVPCIIFTVTAIIKTLDYLSPIEANSPTKSFEHYYMYNCCQGATWSTSTINSVLQKCTCTCNLTSKVLAVRCTLLFVQWFALKLSSCYICDMLLSKLHKKVFWMKTIKRMWGWNPKKPTKLYIYFVDGNDTTTLSHHPYILCRFPRCLHKYVLYVLLVVCREGLWKAVWWLHVMSMGCGLCCG